MDNKTTTDISYFWKKKVIVSYSLAILVFWIHSSSFANYGEMSGWISLVEIFFQKIITPVAVPLFLIISGALFYRDYSDDKYLDKIKRRIYSLLLPYLLWNTFNMIFQIVATKFFESYFVARKPFVFNAENILDGILHYKYNGPFWFIFALMIFTLFSPAIDKIIKNKYGFGCVVLALWILDAAFEIGLPTPFFFSRSCIIYYLVGAFIGKHRFNDFTRKTNQKTSVISLFVILLIWGIDFVQYFNSSTIYVFWEVPKLIIFALCVWMLFDLLVDKIQEREFMKNSFWVFALHINVGAVVAKLLYFVLPKQPVFSIINFVVTTICTLILIEVMSMITGKFFPRLQKVLSGGR